MSYKATHWAWELGLKMPEKFVLVALADMADEKQSCYPGQATLSSMTGASESTVRRALKRLEDGGLLVREERRTRGGYRTSDRYVLQVGATLEHYRSNRPVGAQPTGHTDDSHRSEGPTSPVTVTGTYKDEHPENTQGESPDTSEVELFTLKAVDIIPSTGFEDFWSVWPKKVGKPDAERAWVKAVRSAAPENIVAGAIAYRDNPGIPERKFIPHPATWLNRQGWNDELPERSGRDAAPMQRAHDVLSMGEGIARARQGMAS